MRLLLVVGLLAGCDADHARCERAIGHIERLVDAVAPPAARDARLAHLARELRDAALTRCYREGLSPEQLACVLAAREASAEAWAELERCPAIRARRPGWLRLPALEPYIRS